MLSSVYWRIPERVWVFWSTNTVDLRHLARLLTVNIVDLGLIYVVDLEPIEDEKFDVKIEMTMTSPMCPAGPQLIAQSKTFVSAMEEVNDVEVKVVMEPPWTPEKMTDDARDKLGIF